MKSILLVFAIAFALAQGDCGDSPTYPTPIPPESGREAMLVDGSARSGRLEKQPDGTYFLRYSDSSAVACSANELVLFPEAGNEKN